MGMDRKIEKKKWPAKKIAALAVIFLFVVVVIYLFLFKFSKSTLNVQRERITISTVTKGPFQEFIPIIGNVLPIQMHFLTAAEGGRVDKIYLKAGEMVKKGDKILELANTDLLLNVMWREAEFFQQTNNLRQTRLSMEQYRLQLNQNLAQVENQLQQRKRTYERYKELMKDQLIPRHEYELSKDEYDYWARLRELTIESQEQELKFRKTQIDALEAQLKRMEANIQVAKEKLENLIVKAPVDGHLTSLDAEIGQSMRPGEQFGQIDILDGFRVRAGIDEHYIARIEVGKTGKFDFTGNTYRLSVTRVYPEVREGRFEVDMEFMEKEPEGIRRGQTLHISLELSDVSEALLLPRGGFYQTTGGNWVYVVDEARNYATKRKIRLNRYNTLVYEVMEGLEPGEKVITSSYESFGNMERLILK